MDQEGSASGCGGTLNLLPQTDEPMELEERRRTFWVMVQLNSSSAAGVCWDLGPGFDHAEISTYLPVDHMDESNPGNQTSLAQALKSSLTGILCPLQAAALVASLNIRCISHISQVHKQRPLEFPTYDFWTHHHHLNELISHVSNMTLAHLDPTEHTTDPNVLSLNMILQATIICLHQAAISRVARTMALNPITRESEHQCINAGLVISSIVRYVGQISAAKMNPSIPWTFYVVLQYLVRRTQAKPTPTSSNQPGLAAVTPHASPLPSPIGSYPSRKSSMSTSDRFGAFLTSRSEASLFGTSETKRHSRRSSGNAMLDSARLLDSIEFLRSRLGALKATNPLAKVFEAAIEEEMVGGEAVTRERVVGLARFSPSDEGRQGSHKFSADNNSNVPINSADSRQEQTLPASAMFQM